MTFPELRKNLKKDFSAFKKVKLAILGDSATQFVHQAIKGYGYNVALRFDIYEADYNQVEQQIQDPGSGLYAFAPEYVLVFESSQKLLNRFYAMPKEQRETFAEDTIASISDRYDRLLDQLNCKLIYCNFPEINDGIFGNFANKVITSFPFQQRKLNYQLMELASQKKNLFVNDVAALQYRHGCEKLIDLKNYISADMILSLDMLPYFAKNVVDIIMAAAGRVKKCLVLDLDNTLWGGVIGDDGLEKIQIGNLGLGKAFTELQYWALELKKRGVILAVCSKNTESIAKEAFKEHPEMVLRLKDISLFVANWENKVNNLRYIQETLNIGFDAMVFLDDNPFERNMVREQIPELTIPELPEDPAEYVVYLRNLNLFETASYSENDEARTRQYQQEAKRREIKRSFANEHEFLNTLEMLSEVSPFNKFNVPRVAQLTQRSNQFNLRTKRYSEEEIAAMANSEDYFTFSFRLEDKFGDNGLISVVILEKQSEALFIDTWIMSCRVLKRGMENFVLNKLVEAARETGFDKLVGEYLPTSKNSIVENHYTSLGFTEQGNFWVLNVNQYEPKLNFIREKTLAKS